jgi:murein L,D-transpeptidase YcbB/YkuD
MRIMPRQALKLVTALACMAVFVGSSTADARPLFKKRFGFIERLFGSPPPPRRTIFDTNANLDGPTWWEQRRRPRTYRRNNDRYNDNNVDIIYGEPAQRPVARSRSKLKPKHRSVPVVAEYNEPEPLPGLGMGIIPYQPPLVSLVVDPSFSKLTTSSPEAEAIRLVLSSNSSNIRTIDVDRKAVLALYKTNNFKPLWTAVGHPTARAIAVLKTFENASSDGLVAANYLPPALTDYEDPDQALAGDAQRLAQFDVGLTVQAVKYARHLSGGQFEPNRLSLYNDIKPEPVKADLALRVLQSTPYPDAFLASLAPQHPQYGIFKQQLSNLSGPGPALDLIATGNTVKVGKTDPRISQIRSKLQVLDFLSADNAISSDEELLDKTLSKALKAFQKANKIKQTGTLDAATVKAFNSDHRSDERSKLISNMERLRWLPKNLGKRHVIVNQAAFEANLMDRGKSTWNSRVIVGRPMTQTYAFSDKIETVVFNPTWGVPASIIVNEYGPKGRKDPGYLDRNGFKVINAKGEVVSSKSINWWTFGQTPNFGVQQPAGDGNALGELKFLFPNSHDIYMHDTPTRKLFSESTRAFSHGCVRVQNPRNFAQALLGWKQSDIAAAVEAGESLPVTLKEKVPVHVTYFTAWASEDGKINYYDDIYGRDAAMAKAFAYGNKSKNPGGSEKIVQNTEILGGLIQN